MLNTTQAISDLLQGSILEGKEIQQLAIDESSAESAFVIEVPCADALDAWGFMRSHLSETGRYPVLTDGWGSDDYFSRFYYEEEEADGKLQGISPKEIIARVPIADVEAFLSARRVIRHEDLQKDLNGSIEYPLARTRKRFGECPNESEIRELIASNVIQSTVDLEKWLFDWELQHFTGEEAIAAPDTTYLNWFEPDGQTAVLMLLPIENGWDSLAYLHWFGACSAGTTVAISLLKRWNQQYNAELVCHYGTMLQLKVGRLPETPEEAFELAWQQEAIAECTTILPGVSLRDHARSLLTVNQWFLHERP